MSLAAVRKVLGSYADRGVFRAFVEEPPRRGRHGFRFVWLKHEPMVITYEPARETVSFPGLLDGVEARSPVRADVRRFLAESTSRALPSHRRVDPDRVEIRCTYRKSTVSIALRAKRGRGASYAARRLVNLAHELFVMLREAHPEYDWAHLDGSRE